jgi:GntR family transcriptional regulator
MPAPAPLRAAIAPDAAGMPLYRAVKRALLRAIEDGVAAARPGPAQRDRAGGRLRRVGGHAAARGRRAGGRAHPGAPPGPRHLRRHAHQRPLPVPVLPRRAQPTACARRPYGRAAGFERTRTDDDAAAALGLRSGRTGAAGREPAAPAGPAGGARPAGAAGRAVQGADREALRERPSTIYQLYQTEFGITVVRAHERPARWVPTATPRACWAWRRARR